mmetsp:Transcript_37862/g.95166  ORF Transcript_37862/g.95166 Transcript_37862/m.95166 type:complete len:798 (+) Transcript_37862:816-3209(+)
MKQLSIERKRVRHLEAELAVHRGNSPRTSLRSSSSTNHTGANSTGANANSSDTGRSGDAGLGSSSEQQWLDSPSPLASSSPNLPGSPDCPASPDTPPSSRRKSSHRRNGKRRSSTGAALDSVSKSPLPPITATATTITATATATTDPATKAEAEDGDRSALAAESHRSHQQHRLPPSLPVYTLSPIGSESDSDEDYSPRRRHDDTASHCAHGEVVKSASVGTVSAGSGSGSNANTPRQLAEGNGAGGHRHRLSNADRLTRLSMDESYPTSEEMSSPTTSEMSDQSGRLVVSEVEGRRVVCAGTLEQLLDELFSDEDDREGSRGEYGSVFLMMHTYFIQSSDLLDVLLARFQTVAQSTDLGDLDKKALRMQLRIVNLLKKWMSSDFLKAAEVHPEMLERLRAHCSALQKEVGGQLASWGKNLERSLELAIRAQPDSLHPTPVITLIAESGVPSDVPSYFDDLKSSVLAEALTQVEFDHFYCKLPMQEFLNRRFASPERSPFLQATVQRFNRVTFWVATLILLANSPKARAKRISKFIQVAERMAELNNFSGVLQMVSALHLASIIRLKQSWKHVPIKLVATLGTLGDLMTPNSNYEQYRLALNQAPFPVLPYQGVLTKDLTFIEDAHMDFLPNGLINFEKLRLLGRVCLFVRATKSVRYSFAIPEQVSSLVLQPAPVCSDSYLYSLSKELEPSVSTPKDRKLRERTNSFRTFSNMLRRKRSNSNHRDEDGVEAVSQSLSTSSRSPPPARSPHESLGRPVSRASSSSSIPALSVAKVVVEKQDSLDDESRPRSGSLSAR